MFFGKIRFGGLNRSRTPGSRFFIFLILAILATFCSARGSESWIKCCEDQKENPTDEQTRPEEGHYYDSPADQNEEILPLYDTPS